MHSSVHNSIIYNRQGMEVTYNEWIKKMWYMYTTEYYSVIKNKRNFAIWNNMDEPGGYDA